MSNQHTTLRDRFGLTEKQALCVGWRLTGMTVEQISRKTGLGRGTVKHHLRMAYRQFGVQSQAELTALVMRYAGVDLQTIFNRVRYARPAPARKPLPQPVALAGD